MTRVVYTASLLCIALLPFSVNAEDATGETLFRQCIGCHQVGEDARHQFGPTLNGVVDRAAARVDGYTYSDAFSSAADTGLVWTDEKLDEFLTAPMQYILGTKMVFPGVADDNHRAMLIEYLKQFDAEGKNTAALAKSEEPSVESVSAERKDASEFKVPDHGVLHLGRAALEEEVLAWDIDVRPDGMGLPKGSGNAIEGELLYDAYCASCHGDFGEGTGRWPILAGGHETLTEDRPEKTIGSYWPYLSTVYDYIRRAMPFGNARSLSDNDVYAITAYLLYLNDLEDEEFELNSENFTAISLPNEENFTADTRSSETFRGVTESELCMSDCVSTPAKVVQRARVLDVTPDGL